MIFEFAIIIIIGLISGGVVNALADDLPLRRKLRLPRYVSVEKKRSVFKDIRDEHGVHISQSDDEPRPIVAWLGITAFLFGRRASPNGVKLTWRYPLAEILTVILMLLTWDAIKSHLDDAGTVQFIFWLIYMAFFVLITVIDIEYKLILFVVIIPFGAIALLDAVVTDYQPSFIDAVVGGAAGFVVFFILYNGGFLFTYIMGKLRGEEIKEIAFGYGDVMMATVSGLVLGWRGLIFAMFITVFLGAFGALLYLLSRRLIGARYSAFTALPYGPYIVVGTIIMLLYRVQVRELFLMN